MVGYLATNLTEALCYLDAHHAVPYAGGTDLMLEETEDKSYVFIHKVPELRNITQDRQFIRIGAACTFTELERHPLCPAILRKAVSGIAAPAIRNLGTIGGNIGNGSPKADTAPVLYAVGAMLRILSAKNERIVPIKDFYLGRRRLDLSPNELIAEVLIPKDMPDAYYYKKVAARNALAISRVSIAATLETENGKIAKCAVAFGAIGDTVVFKDDVDSMLTGKTITEAKALKADYLNAYDKAITPIRGRVSEEYRKDVCMNLLRDFLESMGIYTP